MRLQFLSKKEGTKLIRATSTDKNCVFEQKERKRNEISIIALIEYTDLLSNLFFFFFDRMCAQSIQRTSDITELDMSKRCKDLASFMESLLQETRALGVVKDGPLMPDDRSFSVTISYVLVIATVLRYNYRYVTMRFAFWYVTRKH